MLRTLILSSRFPDTVHPLLGNFVGSQARALAARPNVAVEIVAPLWRHGNPPSKLQDDRWKGLKVYRPHIPGPPATGMAETWTTVLAPLLSRIRDHYPFDVLHADFLWPDGAAAAEFATAHRVRLSIKGRGEDVDDCNRDARARAAVLAAAAAGAGFLAISAETRRAMIALGLPATQIAIHYPGLDHALFRPSDRAAAKTALRIDGPLLLTVGNLIPRKRQALVIEALAHLPGATLILAGGGPDADALRALAARLGVADRVRLFGPVPHELLPRLFAAADVTVAPSTDEGLGNARLESLACGTPLVTTAVGDGGLIVRDPAAGRVVAADARAIAAAAAELLATPVSREMTAATVRRFSWERNAEELEQHLRRLAGGP